MKYYDGVYVPSAIKIIPMTNRKNMEPEFTDKTIAEIQQSFFTDRLPYDKYRFREKSIKDIEGTLVLFQFDKNVIAAAILEKKYFKVEDEYKGYYRFYPDSIIVFDPIDKFEIRDVKPTLKHYGSTFISIDHKYYPTLLDLLKRKNFKFSYKFIDQGDEKYQSEV